jgi:hypothetical protein
MDPKAIEYGPLWRLVLYLRTEQGRQVQYKTYRPSTMKYGQKFGRQADMTCIEIK